MCGKGCRADRVVRCEQSRKPSKAQPAMSDLLLVTVETAVFVPLTPLSTVSVTDLVALPMAFVTLLRGPCACTAVCAESATGERRQR